MYNNFQVFRSLIDRISNLNKHRIDKNWLPWLDMILFFSRILMTQPVNITWYPKRQNHNETGFRGIAIHYNIITNQAYNFYIRSHDISIEFQWSRYSVWSRYKIMMTYQQMKGGCQLIMRSCIFTVCLILSINTTSEGGKKHNNYFKFIVLHFCKRFLLVYINNCIMCYFLS